MPWLDKYRNILASRPLQTLARLVLGGIFIHASLDKIGHPLEFAKIIGNYRILPEFLVTLPALVLPWVELLCGLLLIAGIWARSAAWLLSSLLLTFILALAVNAWRGIDISCGCFSTSAADTESAYVLIFRDLLILIPGLLIVFFKRENKDS
ncbi:MAG: DoxX family membrane protein [Candidatus Aminicenantes bacterium]|nr:DoxX family membrane protein [Candidatus Aminicenantes bacterium]